MKTILLDTMRKYYESNKEAQDAGISADDVIPSSFILKPDTYDQEYNNFKNKFNKISKGIIDKKIAQTQAERNMWIVKPSHTDNGYGIKIFYKDIDSIIKYIKTNEAKASDKGPGPKDPEFVIQKYIERPMVIHKKKFVI